LFKKNILTSDDTCWEAFFSSEDPMYLEVIKDGKSYFGFHTRFSLDGEEKELILEPIKIELLSRRRGTPVVSGCKPNLYKF